MNGGEALRGESFRRDLDMVARCIEEGDFLEGVRAHLVDKDRQPKWKPATLAEVRQGRVRYFLASPWRDQDHPLSDIESNHP